MERQEDMRKRRRSGEWYRKRSRRRRRRYRTLMNHRSSAFSVSAVSCCIVQEDL